MSCHLSPTAPQMQTSTPAMLVPPSGIATCCAGPPPHPFHLSPTALSKCPCHPKPFSPMGMLPHCPQGWMQSVEAGGGGGALRLWWQQQKNVRASSDQVGNLGTTCRLSVTVLFQIKKTLLVKQLVLLKNQAEDWRAVFFVDRVLPNSCYCPIVFKDLATS